MVVGLDICTSSARRYTFITILGRKPHTGNRSVVLRVRWYNDRVEIRPSLNITNVKNIIDERYITEKIEAYNVAISALEIHEAAEPQPDQLDFKLRKRLAKKLYTEIQRWVENIPDRLQQPKL